MNLTPEQKKRIFQMLAKGEKSRVVQYLRHTFRVSPEEAVKLMEKLEVEAKDSTLLEKLRALKAKQHSGVNVPRLAGLLFIGIGLIMLISVAYIVMDNNKLSKRAIVTTGVVLSYSTYFSNDEESSGSTMYTPTFEYSFNGKKYTKQSDLSSSSRVFEIGDEVEILVDPDEPQNALINSFWERWFMAVVLGGMSTMFVGLGYMAYRVLGNT